MTVDPMAMTNYVLAELEDMTEQRDRARRTAMQLEEELVRVETDRADLIKLVEESMAVIDSLVGRVERVADLLAPTAGEQ